MRKPYKIPVTQAFPDISLPEPRVSGAVILLIRLVGRLYLSLSYGLFRIALRGEDVLFETFRRALAGEGRCIVAFRHPNGGEPQLLTWFFLFKLRRFAARKGVRFARRPHAIFVYGYEVARWGGGLFRFIMSHVGALPVHHAKMDNQGMGRIYKTILEGPYPLALAPEGQVSYTTDSVPRLEPGVVRIGFNAAERLAEKAAGSNRGGDSNRGDDSNGNNGFRDRALEILPLSVHYRYGSRGKASMERLLKKIEKLSGFAGAADSSRDFTERLRRCRDHILEVNETRYQIKGDASLPFEERLMRVINAALETAERMLNIKGEGELFVRMYRLRQICWDRIFVPGVDNLKDMAQAELGVMDLGAGEAWHIARHQEIVDFCWYFRVPLPAEDASLHCKIEYVQNLWDFLNRTMGGAFSDRILISPKKIIFHAAPVINLSGRLSSYHEDRKSAVAAAMSDLEKAYLDSIEEANRMESD